MYTFKGPEDLVQSVRLIRDHAYAAASNATNTRKERSHNSAQYSAFSYVLEMIEDYFKARKQD